MIYEQLFRNSPSPAVVHAGLIGAGRYGIGLLGQSQAIPRLCIPAVCDRNVEAARDAFVLAGVPSENICVCENRKQALSGLESGQFLVMQDASLMMDLPLDVIVECTGDPEAGARNALAALENGKHVAMVNKETDVCVGPILSRLAARAGLVFTQVDGDQHGLLMGLAGWARTLGLEIVCGGKSRDGEFILSERHRTVSDGRTVVQLAPAENEIFNRLPLDQVAPTLAERARLLAALPQIHDFDLCEMAIAANGTGLMPDVPELNAPILRLSEIAEALCPQSEGGILSQSGAIETITCLRGEDEVAMGGGVFLVVSSDSECARRILKNKGHKSNRRPQYTLLHRPYHLCGVETAISVMNAALLRLPTGSVDYSPRVDFVARVTRSFNSGETLVRPTRDNNPYKALLLPAAAITEHNPLPFEMAMGCTLKKSLPLGKLITVDDVVEPADSTLWRLRRQQDHEFPAGN